MMCFFCLETWCFFFFFFFFFPELSSAALSYYNCAMPLAASWPRLALLFLSLFGRARPQPPCQPGVTYPGHALHAVIAQTAGEDASSCAAACAAAPACRGFDYRAAGCGASCGAPLGGGCCELKSLASSQLANTSSGCGCGFIVRPEPASLPPTPSPPPPPPGARSVLYILVDDMRAELAPPLGPAFMATPAMARLAATGTAFTRAFVGISVCSPSRMSFLTGRYPARTGTFNFINHFRQAADCGETASAAFVGPPPFLSVAIPFGGAAECCSQCSTQPDCLVWGLDLAAGLCHLHNVTGARAASATHFVGGRGSMRTRDWVSLPQHFTQRGWATASSGKIFHTEEGGVTPPWDGPGTGMPPLQDPPSWSAGGAASMANVNAQAPMRPCPGGALSCSVNASRAGHVAEPRDALCDRIIADDALGKLRAAAAAQAAGGPAFFLAVGFRKPHLPFRHPAPWDGEYAAPADTPTARFDTLDASVPPIAFHQTALAANPYVPMARSAAQLLRRDYYASISWTDSLIGELLDELEARGIANSTLVALHADHGWSLGEGGEWEKFTNTEFATRVPLVIRAPWVAGAAGRCVAALVETVDVYPTLAELAGAPVAPDAGLDGDSLAPLLAGRRATRRLRAGRDFALSVYPRCPSAADGGNASLFWRDNDCLLVERASIPFLGVSLRTDGYRYTEWLPTAWDGASQQLRPRFDAAPVGVELYNHTGDNGTDFDGPFEHINCAELPAYAAERAALSALMRQIYPAAAGADGG